jgi:NADH-quinone oxidoreductase subunit N
MGVIQTEMLVLTPEIGRALLPYALVFAGAILALIACVQRGSWVRTGVPLIAAGSLVVAAFASAGALSSDATILFGRTLASDPFGHFFNLVFLGSAVAVTLISYRYLERQSLDHGEYYVLILLSTLGMMLLASAQDLIVLFLGLELMSFAIYALVGFRRNDRRSNEAALKYFILGSAASGILLYGAALLYGTTGTLQLRDLWATGAAGRGTLVYTLGAWLLVVGLLFKVAAVPFHMWMPDVYEGAPTPITAFMTTGVKVAAFASFLRLFLAMEPASDHNPVLYGQIATLFRIVAVATMVLGNLLAVVQTNLKRMLAYSSIGSPTPS